MEFDFNLNHLFPDNITLVTQDLLRSRHGNERDHQRRLEHAIDEVGKRSAKAQMLSGSITSLRKSLFNNHHIYILKEPQVNKGHGCIIGFIKVGKKRLFLLDHEGTQNEIYPMCVLDFYVHESQQRRGCGLRLFKHMLKKECVKPSHLAIDRPSHKFLSFFKKHFNMVDKIPQVNNFVIFEGFFNDRTDVIHTENDKFSNFRIRPLSRAVSDDVIRRHKEFTPSCYTRPASGQTEGYGFMLNRNNRRRRWNPDGSLSSNSPSSYPQRPNFYSRFTHEPVNDVSRSNISQNNLKEIINHHTKSDEEKVTRKPVEDVMTETINTPAPLHRKQTPTDYINDEHSQNCVTSQGINDQDDFATTINKSSNLLRELKEKDEALLNENAVLNSGVHRRRHWQERNSNRRTSWNIFGVPTANYWTLK